MTGWLQRAALLAFCFAWCLAAMPTAAFAAGQPDKGQVKLSKAEQEKLALDIFKKLRETPRDEFDTFRRLYYEVIEKCPDTERAEIAHWRLSNLLLLGYDPPRTKEAVALLERFLKRYPKSKGVPQVQNRLARYYEEDGKWCEAAALYEALVPQLPPPPHHRTHGYWFSYAKALEECGKKQQAVVWYKKVLDSQAGKKTMLSDWAAEALKRLGQ